MGWEVKNTSLGWRSSKVYAGAGKRCEEKCVAGIDRMGLKGGWEVLNAVVS